MTDNTVKEFSKVVGLPVARLIDQLELAGVNKKKEDDLISDEEKMQLLDYFRNSNDVESDDSEEQDDSLDEIVEESVEKKTKTVVRKKKVFSKVNKLSKDNIIKEQKSIDALSLYWTFLLIVWIVFFLIMYVFNDTVIAWCKTLFS